MNEEKISFLQSLRAQFPYLSVAARGEINALDELLTAFRANSIVEIKSSLLKEREKWLKSPDGLVARIADFREGKSEQNATSETVEALVADFSKSTAPNVKKIAKKFDVELNDKNDAAAFENWLRTGVKPPTFEERFQSEIAAEIAAALELRDRSLRELPEETIAQILDAAKRVQTAFKIPGLALFMRGIEVVPTKKSAAGLLGELKRFLEDFALNRYKATQIREMNK